MGGDMYVVPAMLDAYVKALNDGKAKFSFQIDRSAERKGDVFHCSDTMGCKRKRIFKRIGAQKEPKSPVSMRRFLMGDTVEGIVRSGVSWACQEMPDFMGWRAEFHQRVQFPEWETEGTCDILLTDPSGHSVLIDVKSCHSGKIDYVKRGERDIEYLGQLCSYKMGLERQGRRIVAAYLMYVDKDTLRTYPDYLPRGFEDLVMTDYTELMALWKRYKATKEVPPELPFQTERERFRFKKRYETPGGGGLYPQWICDPRYCEYIKNCPKVTQWWESHRKEEER